jgi:tetratricopeptide (TPR) repeat protein/RNA polymerase subunit RPABC4/transcription elongation factor Spt4
MEKKGSALYLCPGCGAFVSESASKCPKCGTALDGVPEDVASPEKEIPRTEPETAIETEIVPLEEPEATSEEDSEPVTLFMCSACGAFTGGDADSCPNCGASMREEELSEPQIKPGAPESDLLDMLVEADTDVSEQLIDDLRKIESAEDVENFIESIPFKDPDLLMELEYADSSTPETELEDIESQLSFLEEKKEPVPGIPEEPPGILPETGTSGAEKVLLDDNSTIAMCSSCGAFVSETAEVCNICGNSLRGRANMAEIPASETPDPQMSGEEADSILRSVMGVKDGTELDAEAGSRFQSDGTLNLCTLCGAFMSQDAESCPVCGTHIEDMPEFVPSLDIAGPEKEQHGLALCPHCGVFIQEGATECLSCVKPIPGGAKLAEFQEEPKADDSDKASNLLRTFLRVEKALMQPPLPEKTFTGLDLCPDCGAFVSATAVTCSVCGNPLFEGADEEEGLILPTESQADIECPNCSASIPSGSAECSVCGFIFGTGEAVTSDEPAQDISDFLENELDELFRTHGEGHPIEETRPEQEIKSEELEDSIIDLLVEKESNLDSIWDDADASGEMTKQDRLPPETGQLWERAEAVQPEENPEPLQFIEPGTPEQEEIPAYEPEETYLEDGIALAREPASHAAESGVKLQMHRLANWSSGVYFSIIAITFFAAFYLIVPGNYAHSLAFIFGTLMMYGLYMWFTDRGTFFTGDVRQSSIFLMGTALVMAVLLHWPLGILTSDTGFLGQPALDRILISASILLLSIGLLWIRARVRYVFAWFSGTVMLFMASLLELSMSETANSQLIPAAEVFGLGAGLIFLSFALLQYEKALNTSIESDVVRGDAHYLRKDYRRALISYNDALKKAQTKEMDVLGSPLVEYDVPWYSKGSALILMGQIEEGIKCLDMALAINPNNEVTWVNKGNAHTKLGDHAAAMECYKRAIDCNPFFEVAWNNLGNVHARNKDYLEALKHYNRAIKINRRYDDAWINKGYVLAKMGKREQAIECLNHVGSNAKGKVPPMERDIQTA